MSLPTGKFLKGDFLFELRLNEGRPGNPHKASVLGLDEEILHYGMIGLPA